MADLPTVNAIDELKSQNEKSLKTLDRSIVSGLDSLKDSSMNMLNTLSSMLELDKNEARLRRISELQMLEQMREAARKQDLKKKDKSKNEEEKLSLLDLLKGTGLLGLGAIITGIAGAIVGLRGWEAKVLKDINKMSGLGTTITNGLKTLRFNALKVFGLTPSGLPIRDPATGKFMKAQPLTTQIADKFKIFKGNLLKAFGLGIDGKKTANTNFLVKGGVDILENIKTFFSGFGEKVTKFFGNVFAPVSKFFSSSGSAIGKIATAIGKSLKAIPIVGQIVGALFAIFDGVFTAINTEGTFFDKVKVFFTAAISDFIGAPLDLLKSVVSWATGKLGFENAEKFLDSFSIEDLLEDLLNFIVDIPEKAFDWIKTLFTDPTEAMNRLFTGVTDLGKYIMDEAVTPAWNWFKGLFGISPEEDLIGQDFNIVQLLNEQISKLSKWFYDEESGTMFGGAFNIKGMLFDLKDSLPEFKLPEFEIPSFDIDFPNPFEGIAEKIEAMDFSSFNLGEWFGGALDLNIGDKLKSKLSELFGGSPQGNIEGSTVTGSGGTSGAAVDVTSREVAQATASPNVTIAAPQTSVQTDASVKTNQTTIAPASPRRGIHPVHGYTDPVFG